MSDTLIYPPARSPSTDTEPMLGEQPSRADVPPHRRQRRLGSLNLFGARTAPMPPTTATAAAAPLLLFVIKVAALPPLSCSAAVGDVSGGGLEGIPGSIQH